jgi:hypothetical protein
MRAGVGAPPEEYWPCQDFDTEPTAFCYAFGQNYQAIQYFPAPRLARPARLS